MKQNKLSQEELDVMSYDDLAYYLLKEENKKMKINELFQKICDLKNLNQKEFEEKIADFFEILTTDKRFTMLEDGCWDLKEKHVEKMIIDEDEDEVFAEEMEETEQEDNLFAEEEEESSDEDLKDLVVIDEDEEGENL